MNAVVLTVKYSYVASTKYTRQQGNVTVSDLVSQTNELEAHSLYSFAESHCGVEDEGTGEETVGAMRKTRGSAGKDSQGFPKEDSKSYSSSVRVSKCGSDLKEMQLEKDSFGNPFPYSGLANRNSDSSNILLTISIISTDLRVFVSWWTFLCLD